MPCIVRCIRCGNVRKNEELRCPVCGNLYEIYPDFKFQDDYEKNFPYIKKWVSLGEVETPIVNYGEVKFKIDYYQPTFSYKDRGSKVLISHIRDITPSQNISTISEDSSGNAGASIAAYGAAAGLKVKVYVPKTVSGQKFKQILVYGAEAVKIDGNREDVQIAAENSGYYYASHVLRPEFRDGIRSLAYEIFMQTEKMPDHIFIPVSAGTLLIGLYSGFEHLFRSGEIEKIPNIVAVQAEAVSPVCAKLNGEQFDENSNATSIADALVSKKPILLEKMLSILRENGKCIRVSDNEIIEARKELALKGIYAEYSSSTVFAAYKKKKLENSLLVLTGAGLKND
ncbi:threonine synthase [Thermoplasma volcanium GSS1]|uniref:Threonine synthase n=1 Tax=Thermoplasma volcanium (strain ATCC 51530 / DSM 4299 / JCM 9571 / NBRC 15438 / GSS1) TaxID=273116 RepID=Q97AP7_THEVO|nr:pyridoxal-phosphate dependent enzyme [Thermoplasma volcanium]BAB59905.1 threonine synthase [Thermoplasma volcanium GSS1]